MPKTPHKLHFAVLAVDTVVFRIVDKRLEVLLVPATTDAFKGKLALPGGLIHPTETADEAAARHVLEKGGLKDLYTEQLYTFSAVKRDPRGRVVSVAHMALTTASREGKSDEVRWYSVDDVPTLGYDHNEILNVAMERLRARIGYTTIIRHLVPTSFTLTELQQAYETVLGHDLDKRNFRKKLLALHVVEETGKKRIQGASRPAELYRFAKKQVQQIEIL